MPAKPPRGTMPSFFTSYVSRDTPIPTNDIWIAALVVEHGLHR